MFVTGVTSYAVKLSMRKNAMPAKKKTEAHIEKEAVRLIETVYGGEALKLRIDGKNGYPDRTVLLPDQPAFTVEFKRPGEEPFASQLMWHRRLTLLGKKNFIVDNHDDLVAILDRAVDVAKRRVEDYEFYERCVGQYL
jgi:hypothetical protein